GGRVQRDGRGARARRAVNDAVDHERGRLELVLGPRSELIGLESPGDFQLAEIRRVDLGERRIAGAADVASVAAPFATLRPRLRRERRRGDEDDQRQNCSSHEDSFSPPKAGHYTRTFISPRTTPRLSPWRASPDRAPSPRARIVPAESC